MKEKIYKFLYNWRYILAAFCTSFVIMGLIAYCYDMIPFGDNTILRMDLYHQYGPLLAELFDKITSGSSLIYSWESGGGGSFLGNFFNYLSSPLSIFILLFRHFNTTDCIAFLITLKAALSASTLTYYFRKSPQFKLYNLATAGFGVAYAFSGYFIAYYWDFMWLDGMLLLPLIILGIEEIVEGKKGLRYCICLAILMFASYYMAYMVCIFSVLYALMYALGQNRKVLNVVKSAGKFIGYSLLAGGIAACALLPTYFCLTTCSATSDSFPSEVSTYYNIFDFLCQHLASLDPTIRSSGEDVLPNIYCGISTVILAILYLYSNKISLREKISRFALLVFMFLSMNINMLNNIWHAFHFPNDLPYRFSYCYSFLLITIAVKALMHIEEVKARDILNVGLGLSIFIIIVEEIGSKNVKTETIIISLVFAILYTILLKLWQSKRFQASSMACIMFCLMFAEVAIANTDNYDIDQPKENYASDYSDFQVLKSRLDEREGTDAYRMELTDLRTRMDPCWYGYNGLSTFSSMAYELSANLQSNLGMFSNYINSYTYHVQTPVYNAMFGLKYIVNNSAAIDLSDHFYTEVDSADKFTAYENNYSLPLAYCVSSDILSWYANGSNPFEIQSEYWEKSTGLKGVFEQIPITDTLTYNLTDLTDTYNGESYTFTVDNTDSTASFTFTYSPITTQNLYIYVKSNSVETITMRTEDGSFLKSQTVSDEPYIFDLGVHEAGSEILIDVPIAEDDTGYVDIYVYGLNEDVFKAGYEMLSEEVMDITTWDDTEVSGTVTAKNDCVLYTSINYDASWDVYIDGEKVSDDQIVAIGNALLGVKIDQGTHEVTFKYHAQGITIGIIISILSLILLLLIIFVLPKVLPQKPVSNDTPEEPEALPESIEESLFKAPQEMN